MKRTRTVAVSLVVLVALVGLAGWWHWHQPPARPGVAPAATAGPGPRAPRDRGDRSELAQPRVMIDDDPSGALRLEGQVIDADEHGVAAATVAIDANPRRTALTDASGSFVFEGLVARPYTLIARAAHGIAGPITSKLTATSEPVVLRLRPAGRLTVTVVGVTGQPIDGATVELRGLDVQRARVAGVAAVIAPVVPGNYQIAAWADGMAHAFTRIQIGRGDTEAHLVLAAGAPVAGKVVDDRGEGIAGARVRYAGASDLRQQASDRFDAEVTGADGSFAFAALPAGSFRLLASHAERAPGSSALLTLDGTSPRTGVVITLAAGATVTGHVVDRQHQPIASARVRIGAAGDGPRAGEAPRQAYSDAAGRFEIKGLPRKALSAVALHEVGSSALVAVDAAAGDVAELTLTIELTGKIAGRVVDPGGQPIEGAQVSAFPALGPGGAGSAGTSGAAPFGGGPTQWRLRGLPEAATDAGGRFELTGLAPGAYRVSAAPARALGGPRFGRGRGGATTGETATASTGDTSVELVLAPDGGVRGVVAFAGGAVPALFTAGTPGAQQTFGGGTGGFALDGLAPGTYALELRGPSFQTRAVEITIEPGKTTDAGTLTVVQGRTLGGTVVADGQPVAGATVYAGRTILGNGSTAAGQLSAATAAITSATKSTTTDAAGAFSLSGFGDGDLTLVAEQDAIGRSRALRLPAVMPGQTELTITLEKFGALHGTLRQAGQPADNVLVTCQSTSTPGAVFTVIAGGDGSYRFDRLAPDTYKVSATLGTLRTGMRFYAKQIDVPAGAEVALDLSVDPGAITVDLTLTATGGVGMALVWLATGAITASTESELALKVAAAGPGAYQRVAARGGSAELTSVAPGAYSLCVAPLPREVQGLAVIDYLDRHGDTLPASCQPITVAAAPATQAAQLAVQVPAFIPGGTNPPPPGGPGSGH